MTLEVRRPHRVRLVHHAQRRPRMPRLRAAPPLSHQPCTLQKLAARRAGRQRPTRVPLLENPQQLPRAPRRVTPPQLLEALHHPALRRVRRVVRPPRTIHQPLGPRFLKSLPPLVPRLAADPVPLAQLADRQLVTIDCPTQTVPARAWVTCSSSPRGTSRCPETVTHVPRQMCYRCPRAVPTGPPNTGDKLRASNTLNASSASSPCSTASCSYADARHSIASFRRCIAQSRRYRLISVW